MDGLTKFVLVLFILIGWGVLNSKVSSGESNKIQVLLDEATKQAAKRGVFQLSDEIVPIESKDCEGTQWIKQQDCSLNGASMDGTEDSCGPGKEIWILDPEHPDFKPATGDGKCKPQERDCEVKCPKPCEGDTWKDSGKCVRKEYTTKGNVIETVLDGTEGKCGEGITELNLDTTASDYKPAVGKGTCPMTKGGYCNVPCPKPEPPKCNSYTGWVENVGLGCVVTGTTKVKCGEKGMKQFYNITTNPKDCQDLVEWRECIGDPCPIDCEGSWSKWSDPKSDEPCGVQPYVESTFNVTTVAQYGGKACEYPDGDKKTKNSGTPKECCIENNDWALKPGTCGADGVAVYTQTYKENKVGGCPDEVKSKKMACCYQKGDWTDTSKCNSVGRKSQKQTTAGNCPSSVKTRRTDCKYISEWTKVGGCSIQGKQTYIRTVVNGTEATQKTEDCCYQVGNWSDSGSCSSTGKQTQKQTIVGNCPAGTDTKKIDCCYQKGDWTNVGSCSRAGKQKQKQTIAGNCPAGTDTRIIDCCYQAGSGWDSGTCSSAGKQTQKQTVAGNCPAGTNTREIDCCYQAGNWWNHGSCSTSGKQTQKQTTAGNCPSGTNTRAIDCCYQAGDWRNHGGCSTSGKQTQKQTVAGNCPSGTNTKEIDCCYTAGDWSNSGSCSSTGKQLQTQTTAGNCPANTDKRTINCCYKAGNWWNHGGCRNGGWQTQKQTIAGSCPSGTNTKTVRCCYTSGWTNDGGCGSDGKQKQKRTVNGSCGRYPPASKQTINCEYLGPWTVVKQWGRWGRYKWRMPDCVGRTGKKHYTRVTKNSSKATTKEEDCAVPCHGYWTGTNTCSDRCSVPGQWKTKTWHTTQTPKNGGTACPSSPVNKWCPATRNCPACKWAERKDWARDHNSPQCHHVGSKDYPMCWNDGLSSYYLFGSGCRNWNLRAYQHAHYRGWSFPMYHNGVRDVPGHYNDQVSSVKATLRSEALREKA